MFFLTSMFFCAVVVFDVTGALPPVHQHYGGGRRLAVESWFPQGPSGGGKAGCGSGDGGGVNDPEEGEPQDREDSDEDPRLTPIQNRQ